MLKKNRKSAEGGSNRVNRGGSWNNNENNSRAANRNNNSPDNSNNNLGFRLASTGEWLEPAALWCRRQCNLLFRCFILHSCLTVKAGKVDNVGSFYSEDVIDFLRFSFSCCH